MPVPENNNWLVQYTSFTRFFLSINYAITSQSFFDHVWPFWSYQSPKIGIFAKPKIFNNICARLSCPWRGCKWCSLFAAVWKQRAYWHCRGRPTRNESGLSQLFWRSLLDLTLTWDPSLLWAGCCINNRPIILRVTSQRSVSHSSMFFSC